MIGLSRDKPAPDRVALGPEVEALVVEALRIAVDHDAERHAVDAGADAAVELGRACVDGDVVALGRIADRFRAAIEEHFQHASHVVGCAADQKIVGRGPPRRAQPVEVRLEAAGGRHDRLRVNFVLHVLMHGDGGGELSVADIQIGDLRVVGDLDAKAFRRPVVRVHQRLPATEEKRIGARELQRAAERRLETHPVANHPLTARRGVPDRHPGERFVRLAAGDLEQILPVLVFGIRIAQHVGRSVVHAAQVARVAAVAAAEMLRRRFEHEHGSSRLRGLDRSTQRGIASAQHENVVGSRNVHRGDPVSPSAPVAPSRPSPSTP